MQTVKVMPQTVAVGGLGWGAGRRVGRGRGGRRRADSEDNATDSGVVGLGRGGGRRADSEGDATDRQHPDHIDKAEEPQNALGQASAKQNRQERMNAR